MVFTFRTVDFIYVPGRQFCRGRNEYSKYDNFIYVDQLSRGKRNDESQWPQPRRPLLSASPAAYVAPGPLAS